MARESADLTRDSDAEFDYCDLVQVSMLYALQGDDVLNNPSVPEMSSVPAYNKLKKRQLSAEQTAGILSEAQGYIEELQQIFV